MSDFLTVEESGPGGGGGALRDPGQYIVIADSMTRKSGQRADYFLVECRVIARINGSDELDTSVAKKYFYTNLSLSEKARWKMAQLAWYMNHDKGAKVDLDSDKSVSKFFCDRECVLTVTTEEWDGKQQARWGEGGRRVTADEKKLLKAVYDDMGRPYSGGWDTRSDASSWGSGSGSATSNDEDAPEEDDVPF